MIDNSPNQTQLSRQKPHMQLNRAQYTALYRIARLNKYSVIPDYMRGGMTRAYDKLATIDLPIGCFYFVEASYRSCPIDWLAYREARSADVSRYPRLRAEIFRTSHNAMRLAKWQNR